MGSFIIINSVLRHNRGHSGYDKDGCFEWAVYLFLFLFFVGMPVILAILLWLGYFD